MTARKNAIARRIDLLSDQWVEFAELPNARVLVWLVRPDEVPMVTALVKVETSESGSLPDLFVELRLERFVLSPEGLGPPLDQRAGAGEVVEELGHPRAPFRGLA